MLKLQDYAALGGNVRADNIFVLRRKSSWANIGTLLEFVRSLSKILEPVAQTSAQMCVRLPAVPGKTTWVVGEVIFNTVFFWDAWVAQGSAA